MAAELVQGRVNTSVPADAAPLCEVDEFSSGKGVELCGVTQCTFKHLLLPCQQQREQVPPPLLS